MADTTTTHCTIGKPIESIEEKLKIQILTEWFGIWHRLAPVLHEVDNCRSIIQRERKQRYDSVNE